MKEVFLEFYNECIKNTELYFSKQGKELEIGAGISFFKTIRPNLIVTDVVPGANVEMVLDAENMNSIEDDSVRAIYAMNCFHHLGNPRRFFSELLRVLKPGAGVVLIEPYYGFIARPFYRNLHKTEHFNPDQSSWESASDMGVMSNANQALSYIVFVRDREIFEKEFPNLEIVIVKPLNNYLRYLLSGGLNFKQLVPDSFSGFIKLIEYLLVPINTITALHYQIVIRKRA